MDRKNNSKDTIRNYSSALVKGFIEQSHSISSLGHISIQSPFTIPAKIPIEPKRPTHPLTGKLSVGALIGQGDWTVNQFGGEEGYLGWLA
ncbi:MAG TPA: hypothetical protein VHT73_19760, partial [Thermodesulfobacteriota bacterium]|nr:hypothetical protein [Thermodesulfobacteriota bacterium]